jgi:hypothetical protein
MHFVGSYIICFIHMDPEWSHSPCPDRWRDIFRSLEVGVGIHLQEFGILRSREDVFCVCQKECDRNAAPEKLGCGCLVKEAVLMQGGRYLVAWNNEFMQIQAVDRADGAPPNQLEDKVTLVSPCRELLATAPQGHIVLRYFWPTADGTMLSWIETQ